MASLAQKSNDCIVRELGQQMKINSKSGIFTCLNRINTDCKCCNQFIRNGGLGMLVTLLRYQNMKVLNTALSILANSCINANIREKVRGTKIAIHVTYLIKNLKLGHELHCRACRLIGNLSECKWHAQMLYEAGVVQALSKLLQLETNLRTYLTAVRAVRNIWSTLECSRDEILDLGIIRSITSLLVMAMNKAAGSESKKYSELAEVCLKAMCVFLVNLDPRCGDQMRGESDAAGYKCIVQYCNQDNKNAIKCLHNLCQIADCRPVLGNSGAIESVISLVNQRSQISTEIISILCLFCREAVNRAKVRVGTGLQLMLTLLKKSENEKYHPMLLHALAQFVYDDPSIVVMVKHGLLDVLVTKLKKMIEQLSVDLEEENVSNKRSSNSPSNQKELKYSRTTFGRFSSDYYCEDWSPGSATSMSSSPPSTPPLPFYSSTDNDENTEDNYSPVCSDVEWEDNEEGTQGDEESIKSCKSPTVDSEDAHGTEQAQKPTNSDQAHDWTLVLLSRLSHSDKPIENLAEPSTIQPLSAYIKRSKNPRASRILTRIIRNSAYLVPLVKQGFVFEAQNLYDAEHYTRQLCALAETGGAIGELSTILLRGDDFHKAMVAVSIPFLIKSRFVLKSLLNRYGGLQLIFRILTEPDHTLHENAIWSICRLASTLQIRPDIMERCEPMETVASDFPRACENPPKPATVTFELDDGTTVDACRHTLCQKSDAFSAMLQGNFSESGKRRVRLRNATGEGLATLILAANGSTFENRSIESLLDAVLLADKFLMADLSDILTESSIAKLNHENFSRAWGWAKLNSCHELKSCCVKRFLTANMSKANTVRAFKDFSNSGNFDEFLTDVKDIVTKVLCQH